MVPQSHAEYILRVDPSYQGFAFETSLRYDISNVIFTTTGLNSSVAFAVNHAATSSAENGSVAIKRESSNPYTSRYFVTPLSTVAREATSMKPEYINEKGNDVTQAWLDYVAPLVGALPKMGRL
ncbi:MAG: hypothetical protein Q9M44_03350 [Ghiorsea sp.]|nr:hypothetical protein [Ghiorsea sp.]